MRLVVGEFVVQIINVTGRKRIMCDLIDDWKKVVKRAYRAERRSLRRATEAAC
jgi:hypothetical protein